VGKSYPIRTGKSACVCRCTVDKCIGDYALTNESSEIAGLIPISEGQIVIYLSDRWGLRKLLRRLWWSARSDEVDSSASQTNFGNYFVIDRYSEPLDQE